MLALLEMSPKEVPRVWSTPIELGRLNSHLRRSGRSVAIRIWVLAHGVLQFLFPRVVGRFDPARFALTSIAV